MTPIKRTLLIAAMLSISSTASAQTGEDDLWACRGRVRREASEFAKLELSAVRKCADQRAAGSIDALVDCTDPAQAVLATRGTLPASLFSTDPGDPGEPCEEYLPRAAFYGPCPAPCESISTSDWSGVSDCMQCLIGEVVGDYADDVIGSATLPAAIEERVCLKTASASGWRIVDALLRGNEKCQRSGDHLPPECERIETRGRRKLQKVRGQASTSLADRCAAADFARISGCASGPTDAGCIVTSAERHGRDLVLAISRLLDPTPEEPTAGFTQIQIQENSFGRESACALRTDGSVKCWGLVNPIAGRFSQMSEGCWLRTDGTVDCLADPIGYFYKRPPAGEFTMVDGTCGLRPDGTFECWPNIGSYDQGPFLQFSKNELGRCGVRTDGSVSCRATVGETVEYDRPGPFTSVAVGEFTNCGLRTDGTIECWYRGAPDTPLSYWLVPPTGTFTQLSVAEDFACAVRTDGTLACWGHDDFGKATPPAGTYSFVTTNGMNACAVATDGSIECWGKSGPLDAIAGDTAVALSDDGRCVLHADNSMDCWGNAPGGPASSPPGTFSTIYAGYYSACGISTATQEIECWGTFVRDSPPAEYVDLTEPLSFDGASTCGLRTDGSVQCWTGYQSLLATPPGEFVSLGDGILSLGCGILTDGSISCQGRYPNEPDEWLPAPVPAATYTQVASSWFHGCGLTSSGDVHCWTISNDAEESTLPVGSYQDIAVARWFVCGIKADGTIACSTNEDHVAVTPPAGTFVNLSLGYTHGCGVRTDGTVACWGEDKFGNTVPPAGTFLEVSAGLDFTCGRRPDQTVECWGGADRGRASPPNVSWIDVDAVNASGCGIRDDGTLACWGVDGYENTPVLFPPSGTFTDVSMDESVACALRTNGAVECWGAPLPAPPAGTYTQVAAGHGLHTYNGAAPHACAVRSDQTLACWGDDEFGQSTPKPGTYAKVAAGSGVSCGLHTDGTLDCWGDTGDAWKMPSGSFTDIAVGHYFACAVRVDGTVACWSASWYPGPTPPTDLFDRVYASRTNVCGIRRDSTVACWNGLLMP